MQANDRESILAWLADVLMQRDPPWPFASGAGAAAVVEIASAEGLVVMLQARVQASQLAVPAELTGALSAIVRAKAAQSLHRQAQCRAILARLDAAGIQALVLKGLAWGHSVYPAPHLRESGDIDLLLASEADVARAVALIAPLGYAPPELLIPGDLARFETTCLRDAAHGGLEVDLHWRLSNVPLFAFRFKWAELWETSIALPRLADSARGLALPLAMIHACMHRAKHLAERKERMKWLFDFVQLARAFDGDDWNQVVRQATARGVASVCAHGLHAAERRFGAFVPADALAALDAAAGKEPLRVERVGNPIYFQWVNWRALPTWRMRWRWLWQQLVPDAAYLRKRYRTRSACVALWRRAWRGVCQLLA